jgi:hypothetical protein
MPSTLLPRVCRLALPCVVLLGAVSLGGQAGASANGFATPATAAGQGAQGVSGYTISPMAYRLNAVAPGNIDAVVFTVSGPAIPGTAKLRLSSAYKGCTVTGASSPWTVTCDDGGSLGETVAGATVADVLLVQ